MKGTRKSILLIAAFALAAFAFAGCGPKHDPNHLKIAVYFGGYGKIWADTLAQKFMEENEGITVEVEANPNLVSEIPNRLQNGSDDDLFFSHGITWQQFALQKYLEPLSDLYETEVTPGVTFEDRVLPALRDASSYNGTYYKAPWTNGAGGIIYNKKLFEKYDWPVPTVYSNPDYETDGEAPGLVELCRDFIYDKHKVDPTDMKPNAKKIKPFVYSSETYYWDYVVFDWWVQLLGTDGLAAYKAAESPDLFDPAKHPEKQQALEAWTALIAEHPEYSMDDSAGKEYKAAQMDFVNGYAAMIPCAQWLDTEMLGSYDPDVCEMAIMPTPFLDGAKTDENGKPIRVNFTVGNGENIIIPAKAPNKALAKKFLLFLAREDNCALFTEKTQGVMLGFDYSNLEPAASASEFTKDVFEINKVSRKFNLVSNSLMVLAGKINLEWAPEGIAHYSSLVTMQKNGTLKSDSVASIMQKNYAAIRDNWSRWQQEIVS